MPLSQSDTDGDDDEPCNVRGCFMIIDNLVLTCLAEHYLIGKMLTEVRVVAILHLEFPRFYNSGIYTRRSYRTCLEEPTEHGF